MRPSQPTAPDRPVPAVPATALHFTPRQRADTALRRALLDLSQRWAANAEGVRADPEPEFLHQLRIALRRSRSLLREVRGIFDPAVLTVYRRELKWLTRWTGPVRDLDVLNSRVAGYASRLAEPEREALVLVRRGLVARRRVERERLLAALESERYLRLTLRWPRFLASPQPIPGPLGRATLPRAVTPALARLRDRLNRRGRRLGPEAPDDLFHRVRIDGKRLRYLLETFRGLYPAPETAALLGELQRLQELLGRFNDCRVHVRLLEETANGMPSREPARGAARRGVRAIRQRLDRKAGRLRQRAVKRLQKVAVAGEGLFS